MLAQGLARRARCWPLLDHLVIDRELLHPGPRTQGLSLKTSLAECLSTQMFTQWRAE